jgi:hypothetical protein
MGAHVQIRRKERSHDAHPTSVPARSRPGGRRVHDLGTEEAGPRAQPNEHGAIVRTDQVELSIEVEIAQAHGLAVHREVGDDREPTRPVTKKDGGLPLPGVVLVREQVQVPVPVQIAGGDGGRGAGDRGQRGDR